MLSPRNIVGPQVRLLRSKAALSQAKLAAQCQMVGWDISREGIAKIEGRVRHVNDSELVFLCRTFRVKPEALLGKI
jgi:transcriptional regulator with XRE-family HTH domain